MTITAIKHDRSLNVLDALTEIQNFSLLPSWIPDWSMTHAPTAAASWKDHRASGESKSAYDLILDTDFLHFRGVGIDTIAHMHTKFSKSAFPTTADSARQLLSLLV